MFWSNTQSFPAKNILKNKKKVKNQSIMINGKLIRTSNIKNNKICTFFSILLTKDIKWQLFLQETMDHLKNQQENMTRLR